MSTTATRPADPAVKLRKLWQETTTDRTRISAYLESRGLPAEAVECIPEDVVRFHPGLKYWTTSETGDPILVGSYPAMVARVTDATGRGVSLHSTYLDPDGSGKLEVGEGLPAKKLSTPTKDGAAKGASIKLAPAGSLLGLSEGIETALAVSAATGQRCWSCLSARGLETVELPEQVRTVHLWADNDASGVGQSSAGRLASRFHNQGLTVYVHIPPEPGTDWLDIYTASGPATLMEELTDRELWRPAPEVGIRLDTVKPELVSWLWPGRIPFGKLSILDGDPGLGKSTVALDIAARVSRGLAMPDGTGGAEPAGVVVVSAEDGLADTIVPRLIAAGADLERIVALDACPDEGGSHPFTMPDDLRCLTEAVSEVQARLVIIDPLMAFLGGQTNAHRDQDIRRVLARVHSLAESTGAAVLVIRHLNKSAGGPAVYRGGGSIGIIGAARSALLVARDPDDEDRRVLAAIKHNLCLSPESLSFRLEGSENQSVRVVWEGASAHKADALLALSVDGEERQEVDEARAFLLDALSCGPRSARSVQQDAREAGISEKRLRRAKTALGVSSEKEGMAGGWVWSLPKAPEDGRRRPVPDNGHLRASSEEEGHLRARVPGPLPLPQVTKL
ncbi:MAG: AAA family ATPase [Armatimonadetes bacterium]|nr:AAA family ATPase [Armatimonadota bacterium]